jgi:Asp-tRNA(Asn)/Glu-tRNA(Gln) amidotransferase A subunit family amidase
VGFGRIPFRFAMSTMTKVGPLAASSLDSAITYAVTAPPLSNHFYSQLYSSDDYSDNYMGDFVRIADRDDSNIVHLLTSTSQLSRLPYAHVSGFLPEQWQREDLSDIRLGIFSAWFNASRVEIRESVYKAVDYLKSRGATVIEIAIPHLSSAAVAHLWGITCDFASAVQYELYRQPNR